MAMCHKGRFWTNKEQLKIKEGPQSPRLKSLLVGTTNRGNKAHGGAQTVSAMM
jgi:hypothetical protein